MICKICNFDKPDSEFNDTVNIAKSTRCKSCQGEYNQAYYIRNKERIINNQIKIKPRKMETKIKKAERLSQLYYDTYSEDQVVELFLYLTNKTRGDYTTVANIRKCYNNNTLGELLRRLDPIAFELSE